MSILSERGQAYYDADCEVRELNAKLELAKSNRDIKRKELIEAMQAEDLPEFALDTIGKRFAIVDDYSSSFLKEDTEKVFDALRQLGYDGIIKQTINDKTLNSTIKEITENGTMELPEILKPYIKIYKYQKISTTKR